MKRHIQVRHRKEGQYIYRLNSNKYTFGNSRNVAEHG